MSSNDAPSYVMVGIMGLTLVGLISGIFGMNCGKVATVTILDRRCEAYCYPAEVEPDAPVCICKEEPQP